MIEFSMLYNYIESWPDSLCAVSHPKNEGQWKLKSSQLRLVSWVPKCLHIATSKCFWISLLLHSSSGPFCQWQFIIYLCGPLFGVCWCSIMMPPPDFFFFWDGVSICCLGQL
jgi:hypothetical protein